MTPMTDNQDNLIIQCVYCNQPIIQIDKPFNVRYLGGFSIQCSDCHSGLFEKIEQKMNWDGSKSLTVGMIHGRLLMDKEDKKT